MPYVTTESRNRLDAAVSDLAIALIHGGAIAGDLNYAICQLVMSTWDCKTHPRYAKFNEIVGALECAKLELYRRAIGPYEDKAIAKNGDISMFDK